MKDIAIDISKNALKYGFLHCFFLFSEFVTTMYLNFGIFKGAPGAPSLKSATG
jgi:hypothetical protein